MNYRMECAAVARLASLYQLDAGTARVSARDGVGQSFFISPPFWPLSEVRASDLIEIRAEDASKDEDALLHAALYRARADAACIIRFDSDASVAASVRREALLPITQNALLVRPFLAPSAPEAPYTEGTADLVARVGGAKYALVRGRGGLSIGLHCADGLMGAYFLDKACRHQVKALRGGAKNVLPVSDEAEAQVRSLNAGKGMVAANAWPALKRRLDRVAPDYVD